ncbi:2-phosphosulfolactate phosphatase [candidate division KSB1 bacterium]|nr:2-phosphosulfolactate phosphatase [candidate division KSB1 bacterium]
MKLTVCLTPNDFEASQLKGKVAVVIDVLRASTSIVTAIHNQCHQIIPVAEVTTAQKLAHAQSKTTTLLCGERGGLKIEGFHLGNSPAEYTFATVRNKTLIFTSTNGARLLTKTREAEHVLVGAFVNISAVVEHLLKSDQEVALLCAGSENQFSLEDTTCAGMMLAKLYRVIPRQMEMNDAALAAMFLYQKFEQNLLNMVRLAHHGRYLNKIGFQSDLILCMQIDAAPVIPVFKTGVITAFHKDF